MVDTHTHILPALDDGAQSMEQSLQMVRIAVKDGIRQMIATPHVIGGLYENKKEDILTAVAQLNTRLQEEGIPLTILPGAEYRLEPDLAQRLKGGELLTLNESGRYLLVELPDTFLPDFTADVLYQIQLAGVTPIIAHPERNIVLSQEPAQLAAFIGRVMAIQVTTGSVRGRFGQQAQKTSRHLIKECLVHIVASDAHSPSGRTPRLEVTRQLISELYGPETSRILLQDNPRRICQGQELINPPPVQQSFWNQLRKVWTRKKA